MSSAKTPAPDEGSGASAAEVLSLVVPVYNEVDRFTEHASELVQFVATFGPASELIVVDDGSRDGTPDVVERELVALGAPRYQLLRRARGGKGAAVRAGLGAAQGSVAAFCDVDLATPLDDLARIVKEAVHTGDLVIGSRAAPGAHLLRRENPVRESLGRLYNRGLRATIVGGVRDTQCGAKAAPTHVWQRILAYSRECGFAWDAEVVAIAQRLGIPVQETPVNWTHDRDTRVRPLRDGLRMVAAVPRIRRALRAVSRHGAS